ncbi:ABC transporter substrate-binding protein [Glacieibacterium frigidum]|uniref:ABC transporter substrate-binding protein n=1 Tax=Glacieibacterium frigidum TaxID=2593303 RepID=A0A552UEI6_9SPHN|nr:ABC transporter substrate-binding protein [Glacieibacterium frigidum]TRW16645.1 ABC transporter substrate-binding protein [Glacieibacterium frigidum]
MIRVAALALLLASPVAARAPRIVSINPCIDAVLVRVADARQIAAISHYSHDPRATSIPLGVARRFPSTSATDQIVALAPDIVIAGGHVDPATSSVLARLGIRLVKYPVPTSIAESVAQVRSIATVAGQPARGETLARDIEAALTPVTAAPVPALIWQGGGMVPGAGTLADDLLRHAGFSNFSATLGLSQWDVLGLEYLVARPPRVLFTTPGATDRLLGHPVLRDLRTRVAVKAFAPRLLWCGGPAIPEALAVLRAARASLPATGAARD